MSQPDLTPTHLETDLNNAKKNAEKNANKKPKTFKKYIYGAILVAILSGLGVLLFITLSGASLFFLDVDEAIQRRDSLGEQRFRVQGITVPRTINKKADISLSTGERTTATSFQIAFNGESAYVIHRGDLANIFTDCLPVILEGRWVASGANSSTVNGAEYYFASSEMLVKHDNNYVLPEEANQNQADQTYKSTNSARIDEAVGSSSNDPLDQCPQT